MLKTQMPKFCKRCGCETQHYAKWPYRCMPCRRREARDVRRLKRARNPEKLNAEMRAWRTQNPDRAREFAHAGFAKCRAKQLRQQCGCCTDAEIFWFYEIAPRSFEVDHVTPFMLGGRHCTRNLQVLSRQEHVEKTKRDNARIRAAKRNTRLLMAWKAPTRVLSSPSLS